MSPEFVFRMLLLTLLLAFMVHRGIQTRNHTPDKERVDVELTLGLNPVLANLLSLVALLSSLIYIIIPTWLDWAALPMPIWLRCIGVPLALAGFALMEWAQRTLGRNWSDTPVHLRDHTLTTSGPYKWVRHPIYTAFLLILSAPLLLTSNALVGLAWILSTGLDISARVSAEETMLEVQFGDSYQHYAQSTGRLLPRFGLRD